MTGQQSGFNPLTWVEDPVKCAIDWAFRPDQAKAQATLNGMQNAWDQAPPGRLVLALSSWNVNLSSGCGGIPYDFPIGQAHWSGTLLNACAPPFTGFAPLIKLIVTVSVVIGCVVSICRSVAAVVGFSGLSSDGGNAS